MVSAKDEGYEPPTDPREVINQIDTLQDELMDLNALIIQKARQSARMYTEIQMMHLQQSERAFEIAQLIALGAKLASDLMGDEITAEYDLGELLASEYGLVSEPEESDEEDEDDDEEPFE